MSASGLAPAARARPLGLALPHAQRRQLWSLHLARLIAFSLVGRPIGPGNETYIDECLAGLESLRRAVAEQGGPAAAAALAMLLRTRTKAATRPLLAAIDRTQYAAPMRIARANATPLRHGALVRRERRRLLFVIGPGLGLGDELSLVHFVRAVRAAMPRATAEIYSCYPSLWRSVEPGVRVRTLVRCPERAYLAIEEAAAEDADGTAAIFANFGAMEMLLPYVHTPIGIDLFDYGVGLGRIDHLPANSRTLETRCTLEPRAPSLLRARDAILATLLGTRFRNASTDSARATRPSAGPRSEGPFVLLLNPLTSKDMPLTPEEWSALVATVREVVPRERPLHCAVYPGLSDGSRAIAARIAAACSPAIDELQFITDAHGAPLSAATAAGATLDAVRGADLMLGMDTFTAHLTALEPVPAIALCLWRNPLFWENDPRTLWVHLALGPELLQELVRTVAALSAGVRPRWFAQLPPDVCREATRIGAPESALELLGEPHRLRIELLDRAWRAIPPRMRHLLSAADAEYAWPRIRTSFGADRALSEVRLAVAQLSDSMFFRLLVLGSEG